VTSPLEGSLAKTIAKSMAFMFLDASLHRDVEAAITNAADPPAPASVSSFACKAIIETQTDSYRGDGGLVVDTTRKVLILAQTLATTPVPGDRIIIRGVTYGVMTVASDPALATWECRVG